MPEGSKPHPPIGSGANIDGSSLPASQPIEFPRLNFEEILKQANLAHDPQDHRHHLLASFPLELPRHPGERHPVIGTKI